MYYCYCAEDFGSDGTALSQELAMERQENSRLLKDHQDKDELIIKLKEEIDLLNRVRSRQWSRITQTNDFTSICVQKCYLSYLF